MNFLKMLGMKPEEVTNLMDEVLGKFNVDEYLSKINDFTNALMNHILLIEDNQAKILKKLDQILKNEDEEGVPEDPTNPVKPTLTETEKRIKEYAIRLGNNEYDATNIATLITKWGNAYNVNPILIAAIAAQESYLGLVNSGDNGLSHGPMHVYKPTFEWIKLKTKWDDVFDDLITDDIGLKYGVYYLNKCILKAMNDYPNKTTEEIRKISAYLYNHGINSLKDKTYSEVKEIIEVDRYVNGVMAHYNSI